MGIWRMAALRSLGNAYDNVMHIETVQYKQTVNKMWLCCMFLPTLQSGVVRFYSSSAPPSPSPHLLVPSPHSSSTSSPSPLIPNRFSPRVPTILRVVPYTPQIQSQSPYNPSSRRLYPTDSAPESLQSRQSFPIPYRFNPRVLTILPVVRYTPQIQPQNS